MGEPDRCRPLLDDDGNLVAMVHGGEEPSEQARQALLEVVAAARRALAAQDPDGTLGERQAATIARIRLRVRQHGEEH